MRLFDAIGHNQVYVIAEMSANHAGRLDTALEIVRAAKQAGADCLKVQTYTADTLTIPCSNSYFRINSGLWEGETLYDLYSKAAMPWEWHAQIMRECEKIGLDFLSTPYDKSAVDFLENLGVECYKIASFELVDIPLIDYIAAKGKPMIMSCGMASPEEISNALDAAYSKGNRQVVLLKCCSEYPAIEDDMNLAVIADMNERFSVPVGFSDHSLGDVAAVAAVALGACVIEKHLCLSRDIDTPDSAFSMEPLEFETMVKKIRRTKRMRGEKTYALSEKEQNSMVFRRSVFAVKDINMGENLTPENIRIIRPGYGLKPKYFPGLLGMKAGELIKKGQPVHFRSLCKGAVLFLTNSDIAMDIYQWLLRRENVFLYHEKLTADLIRELRPSLIISYNYKHIIGGDIIALMPKRIINLHISLLPWNRGAGPNFFSFFENTPKGVSIHFIDEGVDSGGILCQKEVIFDEEKETFASSYIKLHQVIQTLFCSNWEDIRRGKLIPKKQPSGGSFHTIAQLDGIRNKFSFNWCDNIAAFKMKYQL